MPPVSNHPALSLVLPCYNEARSLRQLVTQTATSIRARGITPSQFELVIVNNGSTDKTAALLLELTQEEFGPWIRVVTVARNQGYGYGVYQGLLASRGDFLAWSHADGQCPPEDVFRAWEIARKTSEKQVLIRGKRFGRPLKDWCFSRCFEIVALALTGRWLPEINAQPKLFSRDLLSLLSDSPRDLTFDLFVLFRAMDANWNSQTIAVHFGEREHGESSWSASLRSKWRTTLTFINFLRLYKKLPALRHEELMKHHHEKKRKYG